MARIYARNVTLLASGNRMDLDTNQREKLRQAHVKIVLDPVERRCVDGNRIITIYREDKQHRFDILYSALGLKCRSELGTMLGADVDDTGALAVNEHNQTNVLGLYAAGDVVRDLNQIVVGMGHAAVAATDIHNRCR